MECSVIVTLLLILTPLPALAVDDAPAELLNAPDVMKRCPYPTKSIQAHAEGETLLNLQIDGKGTLTNISVKQTSGSEDLDNAAMECMRKAHFKPATHEGHAITSNSVTPWPWTLPTVYRTCDAAASDRLTSDKVQAAVWPKPAYVCFCFGDSGEAQGKTTVVRSTGYRDADKMAVDVTELKSPAYQARLPGCHLFGVRFDTNGQPRRDFDDLTDRLNRSSLYPLSPGVPYRLPDPYYRSGVQIGPNSQ